VIVADLDKAQELWREELSDHDDFWSCALSPDAKVLALGSGLGQGSIQLRDARTGQKLGLLQGHRSVVSSLVFWPDGRRLASASFDQTIRLWDIRNPANIPPERVLRGHRLEVSGLTLLADGKTLLSSSKDGEVLLWDTGPDRRDPQTSSLTVTNFFW